MAPSVAVWEGCTRQHCWLLIGFGNIAQAVAKRLKGFDCHILYCGPREKAAAAAILGAEYVSLDELLARSDFVGAAVSAAALHPSHDCTAAVRADEA